ncbi:MAG: phospholipid carrier-dependent glycosyltransferase, partial [Oscillochloris sp.]|nr:phospholipid carrier-dependent glycosyltransferase [Oscillochloris sp.]
MRTPTSKLTLALILLLALIWRVLLWAQPPHLPANDELEYVWVARDLIAGRGWALYANWPWLRAPLYPLFLAGSLWLAGGDLHMAALPNLALSVGMVGLIYTLTRLLSPERRGAALLAAGLAAALQTYATFASLYMSETLFALLFGLGLLALARWQQSDKIAWAALAGICSGLACLTRSAGLAFLPVAGLWLLGVALKRHGLQWRILLAPLALALAAALTIAPWTIRNCRAYGRCILIETGGSYNLWAFYEPDESLETIQHTLAQIANPAERADLANQQGMAQLRADPLLILRRVPVEWAGLWTVKPIEDRFLQADYYSDPSPGYFLSSLVLDDLLYVLILCAAPLGLLLARRNPFALLLGLWVVVFVVAGMLTHTEGRYRHFLFVVMIPLAAMAPGGRGAYDRTMRGPTLVSLAWIGLTLLPGLGAYPWEWASSGALRSIYRMQGDQLAAAGQVAEATRAYQAALDASRTPDGWIALGDL